MEDIIGLPPGDYRSDPAGIFRHAEFVPGPDTQILEWEGENCNIQIRVDKRTARVTTKIFR